MTLRGPEFAEVIGADLEAAVREAVAARWGTPLRELAGCASPDVRALLDSADAAHRTAIARLGVWAALADQNRVANGQAALGQPASFADTDATMEAWRAIGPALADADQADDVLVALIDTHLAA